MAWRSLLAFDDGAGTAADSLGGRLEVRDYSEFQDWTECLASEFHIYCAGGFRRSHQLGESGPVALSCIMDCIQCSVAAACRPRSMFAPSESMKREMTSAECWISAQ